MKTNLKHEPRYDVKEIESLSIAAIKKHNLYFITDLIAYLPITKKTFYNYNLNESNEINAAIVENKIKTKVALRNKWFESDNPTLQISLMKLIADTDERKRLSTTYQDVVSTEITNDDDELDYSKLSTECLEELSRNMRETAELKESRRFNQN